MYTVKITIMLISSILYTDIPEGPGRQAEGGPGKWGKDWTCSVRNQPQHQCDPRPRPKTIKKCNGWNCARSDLNPPKSGGGGTCLRTPLVWHAQGRGALLHISFAQSPPPPWHKILDAALSLTTYFNLCYSLLCFNEWNSICNCQQLQL